MSEQPVSIQIELAKLLSDVDQGSAITAAQMQKIQTGMDALWQANQGNPEAQALVNQAWDDVITLAEQNSAQTFQIIAMGNMTQASQEEAKAVRDELNTVQDAIDEGDEEHPRLKDFASAIRADAEETAAEEFDENLQETIIPEVFAAAYEDQRETERELLIDLTGCSSRATGVFFDIFDGGSVSDEVTLALRALMDVCESEAIALEEKWRIGRSQVAQQAAQELQEWNERGG